MRLFIAVELSPALKNYILKVQNSIDGEFSRVKFVRKEQMHLTLKFLGDIQPKNIEGIIEELKKIKFESFATYLDSVGVFPDEDRARVLWIGLKPEENVISLQKDIDEKLGKMFWKEKDFKPHITIGRIKFIHKKNEFLKRIEEIKIEDMKMEVNEFGLIKSTLTLRGPEYEILKLFESKYGDVAE